LAHGATKHHLNSTTPEFIEHRDKRHEIIKKIISKQKCDIILLQEVDYVLYAFLKSHLFDNYDMFFSVKYDTKRKLDEHFGTAVMYLKKTFQPVVSYELVYSEDKNDYAGKNATILKLLHKTFLKNNKPFEITAISIHLSGEYSKENSNNNRLQPAEKLLTDISDKIKQYPNVIFGGDFNCDFDKYPDNSKNKITRKFVNDTFNKNERNFVECNSTDLENTNTTCTFDYPPNDNKDKKDILPTYINPQTIFNNTNHLGGTNISSAQIDRIYCETSAFEPVKMEYYNANCENSKNYEIWKASDVLNPSDHYPIVATVKIIGYDEQQTGGNSKKYYLKCV
jgi:exonuclease III